jgi:FolB domain-containing protein
MAVNNFFDSSKRPVKRRDQIALRDLEVRCVIGLYPHERDNPQPLYIDLLMELNIDRAVREHALSASVDYSVITTEIKFILGQAQFELLETAAHAICHFVIGFTPLDRPRAPLEAAAIQVRKPKALASGAYPELSLQRDRSDHIQEFGRWQKDGIRCLHINGNCLLFQVDLMPGDTFGHILSDRYRVRVLTSSAGLMINQDVCLAGDAECLAAGEALSVPLASAQPKSVLVLVAGPIVELGQDFLRYVAKTTCKAVRPKAGVFKD